MRFWLDTEFYENQHVLELISIAIVAEDGHCYYAVVPNYLELCRKSDWLMENVLPHLFSEHDCRCIKPLAQIRDEVLAFTGQDQPEFWAYYAAYDWVVLCWLFGRMIDRPQGWPMLCRDIKQYAEFLGVEKLPEQTGTQHNALDDARWAQEAWDYLERIRKEGRQATGACS